jgi:hypothetical protein
MSVKKNFVAVGPNHSLCWGCQQSQVRHLVPHLLLSSQPLLLLLLLLLQLLQLHQQLAGD